MNEIPIPSEVMAGADCEKYKPTMAAGIKKTNPANGPAMPISNKARLDGMRDLILMTAPKVPTGGKGEGIK